MKNNYLLSIVASVVLTSGSLIAQPTLSSSNMTPIIGVGYQNFPMNPAGVDEGPAGANITWDFSQLTTSGNPYTVNHHHMAGSAYTGQFPSATHYSTHTINNSKSFSIYNSSEWSITGMIMENGPTFQYSDPHKFLSFPFTYNNSFSDAFTATFTSGVPMTRQGTATTTADGYGTLLLPGGITVQDVLRVKVIENFTDSWNGTTVLTSSTESYYWFIPGYASIIMAVSTLDAGGTTTKSVLMSPPAYVGTPESVQNDMLANIYPNPASGKVFISTSFDNSEKVSATLVNSLGQEVRRETFAKGNVENSFTLEGLSSGVYFLQLQGGHQSVSKKIVVQ